MKYAEALAWLYSLQRFGIKLGLENIRRLISELRINLDNARVIHVAGTNGKGSVCAMIESICRAAGDRTGLFTSPHLITFRERIRVHGDMISEDAVANSLAEIWNLVREWDPHPTFFEITTALALKHFSEAEIGLVILETGLGGRLDATNAVQPDVAVITPIDLDHQKWLGNSLKKIAAEKAGIIKAEVPVVCSAQHPDAELVLRKRAQDCGSPIEFVTAPYGEQPSLAGAYQRQNAALAIAAIRAAGIEIEDTEINRGLATVEWPARFQKWDERTIIDGAHNPAAAQVLAETWRERFGDQRATLVLAILSDKDLRGICEALISIAGTALLPKIQSERAADPKRLAKVLRSLGCPKVSETKSIADSLDQGRQQSEPVLITGSLHFAGEVLAHLQGKPAAFEECNQ